MKTDHTLQMLLDTAKKPGCPVCSLVYEAVEKAISGLFYESILDPDSRTNLRLSLGFCREHTWLALDAGLSDALGFAILFQDLINAVNKSLPSTEQPRTCPACAQEMEVTQRSIQSIARALKDKNFLSTIKQSQGICLPHLRMIAEMNPKDISPLIEIQREKLLELHHELGEFVRKNDYRFQHEGFGKERDSYKRAVAFVVGKNRHHMKDISHHAGWGKAIKRSD